MTNDLTLTPAEIAANQALKSVLECIDQKKSFVLEAGAGAGKTYTLIHTLKYLIENQSKKILRKDQRIACITFTNVATEEIKSRIDSNPVVIAETLHSFCWSLIKNFQSNLRNKLPTIGKWSTRINEENQVGNKPVRYELGYPKLKHDEILLGHDDVIELTVKLMDEQKFRKVFAGHYPILLIDEYQDTDKTFVDILKKHVFNTNDEPLIGFFGDHWQKIYGKGCGKIEHPNLTIIGKRANFRSEKVIVEFLNRIRPGLPQEISDVNSSGTVDVFHTNNWVGSRRTESHWKDDLPANEAHNKLEQVRNQLESKGWNFDPKKTKILMLTHNVLAEEQGYKNIAGIFPRTESYIKKEDNLIAFLIDIVENVADAYEKHKFGEMFSILGKGAVIKTHADKLNWTRDMNNLIELRKSGTIGEVIELLKTTNHPQLTEKIERKEERLQLLERASTEFSEDELSSLEIQKKLKTVQYKELMALSKFIDDKTPFSTKHGVKGIEFENVLVVFGRGWNQYNFGQMLEWVTNGVPSGKEDTFERNRNLFYVACSRPKKRLALLFTQKLSVTALQTLSTWFKRDKIHVL